MDADILAQLVKSEGLEGRQELLIAPKEGFSHKDERECPMVGVRNEPVPLCFVVIAQRVHLNLFKCYLVRF